MVDTFSLFAERFVYIYTLSIALDQAFWVGLISYWFRSHGYLTLFGRLISSSLAWNNVRPYLNR